MNKVHLISQTLILNLSKNKIVQAFIAAHKVMQPKFIIIYWETGNAPRRNCSSNFCHVSTLLIAEPERNMFYFYF